MGTYTVRNITKKISDVDVIPLREKENRRLCIQAKLIKDNPNPNAPIKISFIYQKRHSSSEPWQKAESFNLAQLPKGHEIQLQLSSQETLKLKTELDNLYALAEAELSEKEGTFKVSNSASALVFDGKEKEILDRLLSTTDAKQLFFLLEQLEPETFEHLYLLKEYENKQKSLQCFKAQMDAATWKESQWATFFRENLWIFGHGLDYRIMNLECEQPNYGGYLFTGKGMQKGDYLFHSSGYAGFTVLVELKRPDTNLLDSENCRNGAYPAHRNLTEAIAQLQTNCHAWNTEGARRSHSVSSCKEKIHILVSRNRNSLK
jgi:hypothetical protein